MTFLIVLGVYIAAAALLAYISKRRFGWLALGLVLGAFLANLWALPVAQFIAAEGLTVEKPPLASLVAVAMVLIAAIILTLKAPKSGGLARVLGAIGFGVAFAGLTYQWFRAGVILDSASAATVVQVEPYISTIVTVLLLVAVFDVVTGSKVSPKAKK